MSEHTDGVVANWQPLLTKHFAHDGANERTQLITVHYPVIKKLGYMMVVDPIDTRKRIQVNFERVVAMLADEWLSDIACGYCKQTNTVYVYDADVKR